MKSPLSFKITVRFPIFAIYIILLYAFFLTGCATRYKKALSLMADKNYDEALVILEKLTTEDPKDSDYQVALKQAKLGVIDQSLIRVRMTRLANNNQESLETLRKTFDKEIEWNLFPTGAVAFTQNEEIGEAFNTLIKEVASLNQKGKHLRVLYLIARYKTLFTEQKQKAFDIFYSEGIERAKTFCVEKSKSVQSKTHYYNLLIQKWCNYAGKKITIPPTNSPLYASVKLKNTSAIDVLFLDRLTFKINSMQPKLGWIDLNSKQDLIFNAQGFYRYNDYRHREFRNHTYSETVTEKTYVTKSEQDPVTGKIVTHSVPADISHQVQRNYPYYEWVTEQVLDSQLSLIAESERRLPDFSDLYSGKAKSFSHDYSVPNIGLYPHKTGQIYTTEEWANIVSDTYLKSISSYLQKNFDDLFCKTLSASQNKIELINQSLMCLRQTAKSPPSLVSQTFEAEYQMNSIEMESLFKVVD